MVHPVWKTWKLLKTLKIELQYNPVIPLLVIHPKEIQIGIERDICMPSVHCSTTHSSQDLETT